jgi:DMSO/TMAO reductase YedYZ heme-binding membrane subunit
VLLSLPFARRRLSQTAWYRTHLAVYLGLALAVGHQLELGGDLTAEKPWFSWAWYALLAFTAANAAWFRLLKPRLVKNESI